MKKLLLMACAAACLLAVPTVSEARRYRSVYVGPGWNRTVVRERAVGRPVIVAPGPVVVPQRVYYPWGPYYYYNY